MSCASTILTTRSSDKQIDGFSSQIREQIQASRADQAVYKGDRTAYKKVLQNLEQKLAQSLEQIGNKYGQDKHNPVGQLLLEERSKQIDKLATENKSLRKALSSATGLPSHFNRDDEIAENIVDVAMKTQVRGLAIRLEQKIQQLVNDTPWNLKGILSSRPHLEGERAIHSTKMEMMSVISTFLYHKVDAFRAYRTAQPKMDLLLRRFPRETVSTLHQVLMTRITPEISIEDQATLHSCILDILTTATDLALLLNNPETGKVFRWVQDNGQNESGLLTNDLIDNFDDVRGPGDPFPGRSRTLFGAVLFIEPDKAPVILYKGKITFSEDLPSNFDDSASNPGLVEDMLLRNTTEPPPDKNYGLFNPKLLRDSRADAVAQLFDETIWDIYQFCRYAERLVSTNPRTRDAQGWDKDHEGDPTKVRWVSKVRAIIATWIATCFSSLRLDTLGNEARTRRIFTSLSVVIQATINHDLMPLYEMDERLQSAHHNILESAHRLSLYVNRFPNLDWRFRWNQITRSTTPWLEDAQNWDCILCADLSGGCQFTKAPGGFVIHGKLIYEMVPSIPNDTSVVVMRNGLFIHGDIAAPPRPPSPPSGRPPAPPAPPGLMGARGPPPPP